MQRGTSAVAVTTVAGGLFWYRRAKARDHYRLKLLGEAVPVLAENAQRELETLPCRACEEIRTYLHGKTLNVGPFVSHVCSADFNEKLNAIDTEDGKATLLSLEFERKVLRESELLGRLDVIVRETGNELDHNWELCCQKIETAWGGSNQLTAENDLVHRLSTRLESLVHIGLKDASNQTDVLMHRPGFGESVLSCGQNALGLIAMTRFVPTGQLLPAFLLAASLPLWRYVVNLLSDPKPNLKSAISSRLQLLANRAGHEFESEVTQLIARLQHWQVEAVSAEINRCVDEKYSGIWV